MKIALVLHFLFFFFFKIRRPDPFPNHATANFGVFAFLTEHLHISNWEKKVVPFSLFIQSKNMFNLGSNSKKKATNVKLEQYEQGSGPSTQPIIPVRKPKEKSPGPSANAAANRGSRRRTMLREDFASTQPVTIREATQAQKRSAALNEAELSYLTSFKQPRLSMDPPPHRQGHQQRAYASDNLPNADAARDTRPNYDERRKNIQDERNKMVGPLLFVSITQPQKKGY